MGQKLGKAAIVPEAESFANCKSCYAFPCTFVFCNVIYFVQCQGKE